MLWLAVMCIYGATFVGIGTIPEVNEWHFSWILWENTNQTIMNASQAALTIVLNKCYISRLALQEVSKYLVYESCSGVSQTVHELLFCGNCHIFPIIFLIITQRSGKENVNNASENILRLIIRSIIWTCKTVPAHMTRQDNLFSSPFRNFLGFSIMEL